MGSEGASGSPEGVEGSVAGGLSIWGWEGWMIKNSPVRVGME